MALRSSLIASALVAFFCFPPLTVRVRAQDGLQLFHKMQTALGGEEKMASIRDFEECVRAETWDNEGKARTHASKTRLVVISYSLPKALDIHKKTTIRDVV